MNARRLVGLGAGLILFAATGAACSDESVENAEVGECIADLDDLGLIVTERPESDCDEDHAAEVIHLFEHEGDDDDFPGSSELEEEAAEECEGDAFEDYTGTDFEESAISILYLTPTESGWGDGDRETICLGTLRSETVDVSFEGNGEDFLLEDVEPQDDSSGDDSDDDSDEDTSLEDFADQVEDCEGGDMAACDQLYADTPIGSEAEAVALECGGEDPGGQNAGTCEDQFG